jgi:glycosyltransferase involved in cell wall biosynthesis
MTREFARHVRPDATVVVDICTGERGPARMERYPHGEVIRNLGPQLGDGEMRWLLERSDVVYTAETAYRDDFWYEANRAGVSTVLHAMPELYNLPQNDRPTIVAVPTEWELGRMPNDTVLLPVPVATDRFSFRPRDHALTFLHQAAPAMLDRNGTRTVINALPFVQQACRLVLRGCSPMRLPRHTNVEVIFDPDSRTEYWEGYGDADVLLMPRRYAGLSLPVQEAHGSGLPVVMTDLSPNDFYTDLRVPVRPEHANTAQMKGGWFTVYDGDPESLATVMDRLVLNPSEVYKASLRAGLFAKTHSWERLGWRYARVLQEAAKRSTCRA